MDQRLLRRHGGQALVPVSYTHLKYLPHGLLPYETLTRDYLRTDAAGQCHLEGICSVAGLGPGNKRDGSVAYYLSEKVVADDPKGVGAYMMATAQKIMLP